MNYRLFTSLLLMAVLAGLYLWWSQPEEPPTAAAAPAPAGQGHAPLGQLRIF